MMPDNLKAMHCQLMEMQIMAMKAVMASAIQECDHYGHECFHTQVRDLMRHEIQNMRQTLDAAYLELRRN